MKQNVCGLDRTARLAVGTALVLVAVLNPQSRREAGREGTIARWQILATYAGAELLITGLMQWCPTNYLLGIDTCEHD